MAEIVDTSSTSKQTFTGSCTCGNIKWKANLEMPVKISKCNCTICAKPGHYSLKLDRDDFTLLSPSSVDELTRYISPHGNNRLFCPKCGATVIMEGEFEYDGQHFKHFAVNATLLDQPQEGLDVSQIPIAYIDGLADNQFAGPKSTPYPGGLA